MSRDMSYQAQLDLPDPLHPDLSDLSDLHRLHLHRLHLHRLDLSDPHHLDLHPLHPPQ
jgi:hypothetical protein